MHILVPRALFPALEVGRPTNLVHRALFPRFRGGPTSKAREKRPGDKVVVTQGRGGALRDVTKNGCVAD